MTKDIYFYWGNQSMSFLRFMTLKSFNILNPEWRINLVVNQKEAKNTWTSPEEQDNINYKGYDYRQNLHEINLLNIINLDQIFPIDYTTMSNVHIKDILNWHILSTKDSVVADMDIVFSKPITETKGINWDANVNICNYDFYNNYIPVSFMTSKVDDYGVNKFYMDVYRNSVRMYKPELYEACGTYSIPYQSIYQIQERYSDLLIHKMDEMVVFPFVKTNIYDAGNLCWVESEDQLTDPNTIGIHWYGGQPSSQKRNKIITADNYMNYNNIICNTLKTIMKV